MLQKQKYIFGEARFVFKTETPGKGREASSGQNLDADQEALLKLESIEAIGLLTTDMKKELDALRAQANAAAAKRADAGMRAMNRASAAEKPPIDFTQEPEAAKLWRMPSPPLPEELPPTEMRALMQGVIEINGQKTTRDNIIIYADALIQDPEVTWDQARNALEEQFGITLPHDIEHYGTNGGEPTAEQVADLIIKIASGEAPSMDQIAYYKTE